MKSESEVRELLESYRSDLASAVQWQSPFLTQHYKGMIQAIEEILDDKECPYTMSHTRQWCGNPTCRDS